jgi:hypothetical protein
MKSHKLLLAVPHRIVAAATKTGRGFCALGLLESLQKNQLRMGFSVQVSRVGRHDQFFDVAAVCNKSSSGLRRRLQMIIIY